MEARRRIWPAGRIRNRVLINGHLPNNQVRADNLEETQRIKENLYDKED